MVAPELGTSLKLTPDTPPGILTQDFNTNTLRTSNSRTTEPELVSVSQDPAGPDEPARPRAGAPRAKDLHKNRRRIT